MVEVEKLPDLKKIDGSSKEVVHMIQVEQFPPSDIYSDFIASNPWIMYFTGVAIMILFSFLGVIVSIEAKGGINIGGASEGFEARGIPESNALIASDICLI